jgi:hypothetical protein
MRKNTMNLLFKINNPNIVIAMTYKIDYLLAKELVSSGLKPIHLESDLRHFNATQE